MVMMKNCRSDLWYWFIFADGYQVCARGLDRAELAYEVAKHGAIIRKELERSEPCLTE